MKLLPDLASPLAAWRIALDVRRLRRSRADFYDYLSALLQGMQGSRTLKDLFARDAQRHGADAFRGRLSALWLQRYQMTGGDLFATWSGCLPPAELAAIRAAQAQGNTVLIRALSELARLAALTSEARRLMAGALGSVAIAIAVLCALLLAVPTLTLPRLAHAFSAVPPEYYGTLTRKLFGLGAWIRLYGPLVPMLLCLACMGVFWSLPNLTGPLRQRLDRLGVWRLYRRVEALRMLSLLVVVLGRENAGVTQLRSGIVVLDADTSRWQRRHIATMLARIDAGVTGVETFDTGLLEPDDYWFLADMVHARGLHDGIVLACERFAVHTLRWVQRQAVLYRWVLLLACVGGALSVGLWHYAVIDELRRALMMFHVSR